MIYKRRVKKPQGDVSIYWQIYIPPRDSVWAEAWQITRHFLIEMDRDIRSSGADFIIFTNTEYMKICDDWRKEAKEYYPDIVIPPDFDLYYPIKKLREITGENNITLIELEPYFTEYKKEHDLEAPYFYFTCDGHYNKLGHTVATDAVYDNLLGLMDQRMLQPVTGESTISNIESGKDTHQ